MAEIGNFTWPLILVATSGRLILRTMNPHLLSSRLGFRSSGHMGRWAPANLPAPCPFGNLLAGMVLRSGGYDADRTIDFKYGHAHLGQLTDTVLSHCG